MRRALDLLFPRRCPFCQAITTDDTVPCPTCQRELPWLIERQALGRGEFIDRSACALRYQGAVRACIHRYKFSGKAHYAKALGPLAAQCAADHFSGKFDLVTWVPLPPDRLRRRGFDQARLLAEQVAAAFDLPATPTLRKRSGTPQQSLRHGLAVRRANVLGAFSTLPHLDLTGRRVLLVDDVITTGATASECARMLRMAGAAEVRVVAVARAGMGTTG